MKKSLKNTLLFLGGAIVIGSYGYGNYLFGKSEGKEETISELENSKNFVVNTTNQENLNDSISTLYFEHDFNMATDFLKGNIDKNYIKDQLRQRSKNNPKY